MKLKDLGGTMIGGRPATKRDLYKLAMFLLKKLDADDGAADTDFEELAKELDLR